ASTNRSVSALLVKVRSPAFRRPMSVPPAPLLPEEGWQPPRLTGWWEQRAAKSSEFQLQLAQMIMKNYFKRLKTHPGIRYGILLPMLAFAAVGFGDKPEDVKLIHGFLGMASMAVLVWTPILISN